MDKGNWHKIGNLINLFIFVISTSFVLWVLVSMVLSLIEKFCWMYLAIFLLFYIDHCISDKIDCFCAQNKIVKYISHISIFVIVFSLIYFFGYFEATLVKIHF